MMKHSPTFTYHYFALTCTLLLHLLLLYVLFSFIAQHDFLDRSPFSTPAPVVMSSAADPATSPVLDETRAPTAMPTRAEIPAAQTEPFDAQELPAEESITAYREPETLISEAPSTLTLPSSLEEHQPSLAPSSLQRPRTARTAPSSWRKVHRSSARAALREQAATYHPADRYTHTASGTATSAETNAQLTARTQKGFRDERLARYIRHAMQLIADTFNAFNATLHFEYDEHHKPRFSLTIAADGSLKDMTILEPSHVNRFNELIKRAVQKAQPFKALPATVLNDQDSITVVISGPRFIPKGPQQLILYLEEL